VGAAGGLTRLAALSAGASTALVKHSALPYAFVVLDGSELLLAGGGGRGRVTGPHRLAA